MASTILVTVASKYGSTQEIAAYAGRALAEHGLNVSVTGVEDVTSLEGIDAVVAGSAVYAGHWLKPARESIERHATDLKTKPRLVVLERTNRRLCEASGRSGRRVLAGGTHRRA